MSRSLLRAAAMALLGAVAGPLCLIGAVALHPDVVFDLGRQMPGQIVSGFYGPEIAGDERFAWTSEVVRIDLPGLDRRAEWHCQVRFRGGRPPGIPQPTFEAAVDGQTLFAGTATNAYTTAEIVASSRAARGLRLTLTSFPTFRPGARDSRVLGVQVDRLTCGPAGGRVPLPPGSALADTAGSAAVFAALFGLAAGAALAGSAGTIAIAALQALPLTGGSALYAGYAHVAFRLAVWIAAPAAAAVVLFRWRRRGPPGPGFRFAVLFSAVALFVKLLALLHPSKAVIDALFHAHRLEYVLGGRYFFTQVMPGGVQFPYAIALYVFAAPWAALTRDHVALLRIVVSASEAAAGLLLYWAIARTRRDSLAAGGGLVLYHLVPVSYWVIGNANLTNAFGHSAAVATMAALVAWPFGSGRWLQIAGLSVLAAVALLSHVSTFALLVAAMGMTGAFHLWRGGRALLPVTASILVALLAAIVIAVGVYYGRPAFFSAYASVRSARSEAAGPGSPAPTVGQGGPRERLAEGAIPVMSTTSRAAHAVVDAGYALGWSIAALALIGAWRVRVEHISGRLIWALAGWLAASGVFVVFGILAPGGVGHQRQAIEFIARALYAGSPAVVVLAGFGGAWAWRRRGLPRIAALTLLGLAGFTAARIWVAWWT